MAPPNNTANKSSDIAPNIIGLLLIKNIPANSDFKLVGSGLNYYLLIEIRDIRMLDINNKIPAKV